MSTSPTLLERITDWFGWDYYFFNRYFGFIIDRPLVSGSGVAIVVTYANRDALLRALEKLQQPLRAITFRLRQVPSAFPTSLPQISWRMDLREAIEVVNSKLCVFDGIYHLPSVDRATEGTRARDQSGGQEPLLIRVYDYARQPDDVQRFMLLDTESDVIEMLRNARDDIKTAWRNLFPRRPVVPREASAPKPHTRKSFQFTEVPLSAKQLFPTDGKMKPSPEVLVFQRFAALDREVAPYEQSQHATEGTGTHVPPASKSIPPPVTKFSDRDDASILVSEIEHGKLATSYDFERTKNIERAEALCRQRRRQISCDDSQWNTFQGEIPQCALPAITRRRRRCSSTPAGSAQCKNSKNQSNLMLPRLLPLPVTTAARPLSKLKQTENHDISTETVVTDLSLQHTRLASERLEKSLSPNTVEPRELAGTSDVFKNLQQSFKVYEALLDDDESLAGISSFGASLCDSDVSNSEAKNICMNQKKQIGRK